MTAAAPDDTWDMLVVGAGPTGLAMAAQAHRHGASVVVVDRAVDRARESRALGVQPRTLEVLRAFGLADELVRRGNPAVRLRLHAGGRTIRTELFDVGLEDTEFDFLLFCSQAETEAVLHEYLASRGVPVERGVRLESVAASGDVCTAMLRGPDGSPRHVRARFVVGCDGAHSTVRDLAGIPFVGGEYPQTFLLADLEADGLEPDAVNTFLTDTGPCLFFPLGSPASWRLITMRRDVHGRGAGRGTGSTRPVEVEELQALADRATGGIVRLHDPVWATAFRVHHRHATAYRSGRLFLAGDAAHIHSPAGAQGMNTGIQDAVNLGWKLALVCRGLAPAALLDSYDAERRPVGGFVLRFTDRAFTAATSANPVVRLVRSRVVPRVLPVALRVGAGRGAAFRTVSQLGISYRPGLAVDRTPGRPWSPRPRAGDRLPDAEVSIDGDQSRLHEAVTAPCFHLLLAGDPGAWADEEVNALSARYGDLLVVHRLSRRAHSGAIHDESGTASRRLGVRGEAVFVVRPDGHIGHRGDGTDLRGARRYLERVTTEPRS